MAVSDFYVEFSVSVRNQSGKQSSCECSDKGLMKGIRPDLIVEGADEVKIQKND